MSTVNFYGRGYIPTRKYRFTADATSGVTFWTPSTSACITLTDFTVSGAAAGTIQIQNRGTVIFEVMQAGSIVVSPVIVSPWEGTMSDSPLVLASGFGGFITISAGGFERKLNA